MKRVRKPVFFVVVLLIAALTYTAFFGVSTKNGDLTNTWIKGANDIRWGIDIRGGVDVTFGPPEGYDATDTEMESAKAIVETRLVSKNITDYELYLDKTNDRIIVRFPWAADEENFDASAAIQELGETARLTFRKGSETDANGEPTGEIILEGKNVTKAEAQINQETLENVVALELDDEGAQAFSEATSELVSSNGTISIWMDNNMISAPTVESAITDGKAVITGNFTAESAADLAAKIQAGALPFALETVSYGTISATLGTQSRDVMVMSGIVAFILIALFMIIYYRLPGFVASIALVGQVTGMIMAVTGYLPFISSFTLTLPGVAGIILSIGMGVDANIITSERIKEELRAGKTIDGAIDAGNKNSFSAIFDGNITTIIAAVVLMGVFGPPESLFAKILYPFLFMFPPAATGAVYSFGYTLLVGCICNFIFGVTASRLMLQSISRFKIFRKPWLYGGDAK